MSEAGSLQSILRHLRGSGHLSLFLDYDGTLLPITHAPEEAVPDGPLLELLSRLSQNPLIRLIVISGRPLEILRAWLPVHPIVLAGIYGAEIEIDNITFLRGISVDRYRPTIAKVQGIWRRLIENREGFFLEDKGLAVALHARWAQTEEAGSVLEAARNSAVGMIDPGQFRLLDGHRFLEVAPVTAHKGLMVAWFLTEYPVQNDLPVYFGDDNKDEEAFDVIRRWGGSAIAVGNNYPLLQANDHLDSPEAVRDWLKAFISIT